MQTWINTNCLVLSRLPTAVAPQLVSPWSCSPAFPDAVWVASPLTQCWFDVPQRHFQSPTLLMQCWFTAPQRHSRSPTLLMQCWFAAPQRHSRSPTLLTQSWFAAPQRHSWLATLLMQCGSPPSERACCLLPANLPIVVASGWRNTTWNILTSHPPLSTKGNQSLSHDIPLTSQRYLCTKCRAVWYAEKDKEDQQSSQCNHRSTELPSSIQPPSLHNSVASPSQRKWETMANMY